MVPKAFVHCAWCLPGPPRHDDAKMVAPIDVSEIHLLRREKEPSSNTDSAKSQSGPPNPLMTQGDWTHPCLPPQETLLAVRNIPLSKYAAILCCCGGMTRPYPSSKV